MRATLARSAIVACTLAAVPVAANPRPAPAVRIATSLPGSTPAQTVLVGASGQLYRPVRDQARWRRDAVGGVAATVRGAIAAGEVVYAIGPSTPIYRWGAGTWHAYPLANRGTTIAGGPGSIPMLAVGRHLYLLRGKRWKRASSLARDISAVWGDNPGRIYAADAAGVLRLYNGRGWTQVRAPLAGGDVVVQMTGDRQGMVARTRAGVLLAVRNTTAKPVAIPAELGVLAPQLVASDGTGEAWVIALATPPSGTPGAILARTQRGTLARVEDLPALAEGDRFAVLRSYRDGTLLLATRQGQVHLRSPSGAWSHGQVSGELPPGATRAFDAGPARSH